MLRLAPSIELLDISHNQLASAQSSSFFSARKLVHLNLSYNRIQRFDYDSFSPLYQVSFKRLSPTSILIEVGNARPVLQ